ncbi:hypothetical protein ACTEZX_003142 [Yersinia enterocolitica]
MADQDGGKLVYEVDIDTAKLLTGSQKAKAELASLGDAASGTAPGFDKLSKGAKGVSSALAMPEVNKLSNQLAQLSGKIGVSSDAAINASVAQNKFSGALSTAAGKLGAGYVSNVGSAAASLIKHAKEALNATNAQLDNAIAAQKEAMALQGAASQLVATAAAEKQLATAVVKTAESEMQAAEAIFSRKQSDIESLEALLARQKESLKQSEANLEITNSEKAVADAVKARNAVESTQAKILKQSNQAVKEVTSAEDKLTASKTAATVSVDKLTQAMALEVIAVQTAAKANEAAAIATDQLTLAAKAQAVAVTGARSALALLGGPAGVLLLAAAGVYALYQAMSDKQDIEQYKRDIDDAARKVQFLTKVQADAVAAKSRIQIELDNKSLKEAETELAELKNRLSSATRFNADPKNIIELKNQVEVAAGTVAKYSDSVRVGEDRLAKFSKQAADAGETTSAQADANEVYDNSMKGLISSNELLETSIRQSLSAAEEAAAETSLVEALKNVGAGVVETKDKLAALHAEFARKRSLTFEEMINGVQQNVKALKIEMTEGVVAAAAYRAEMGLAKQGVTDPKKVKEYTDAVREQAKAQLDLSNSRKQDNADKSSANAAESVAQKLEDLKQKADLAATSTQELSREQTILTAQQSLGKVATQNQIDLAGKYASQAWDTANAIKAQAAAEKLIPERQEQSRYTQESKDLKTALEAQKITRAEFNQATEIAEQQHQINLARIKAEQAISPQQQALGEVNPLIQEQNEYAQRLALIQQFENAKTITAEQASQARQRILDEESAKQMQSIGTILGAASQGLDGIAGIIEASGGKASTAYKVMFGLSKGFAVAQAGINLQLALSQVLADPASLSPAQKFANYAAIASAGGAVLSSIGSISYGGGRKNGGGVNADSMYQVGEGGEPELLKASNGKQYMIPGDNGKVISNKDMQGGSGGAGTVVQQDIYFHIETTNGIDDATMQKMAAMMKTVSLNTIKDQQRPNGLLRK